MKISWRRAPAERTARVGVAPVAGERRNADADTFSDGHEIASEMVPTARSQNGGPAPN
jgi:hypothetical protein